MSDAFIIPRGEMATATGVADANLAKIRESLIGQSDRLLSSLKKHSHRATNHEYALLIQRMESYLSNGRMYHLNDQDRFPLRQVQAGFYEMLFSFAHVLDWTIAREEPLRGDQNLASEVQALRANLKLYERYCAPFEYVK